MKHALLVFAVLGLLAAGVMGCGGGSEKKNNLPPAGDGGGDGAADGAADADIDGDSDTDGDTDSDGDTDADGDTDTDGDADAGDGGADADADVDGDADTDADGDADADADLSCPWDGGLEQLITSHDGGIDGSPISEIQSSLSMGTYGFAHILTAGSRLADDFTVPDGGCAITNITFYAYQTGSTTTSTIDHVNFRIWRSQPVILVDGGLLPDGGAPDIVFGDTTTNRLVHTEWTGVYRVLDTTSNATNRPIMADTVDTVAGGLFLPGGTYWVDWQTGGTLGSGPWAPPITLLGETTTGNAIQYMPGPPGSWNPALDSSTGTPQGLPFQIQ